MSASCSSCGAPIVWARTAKGKAMPVDATPVDDGDLVLVGAAGTTLTVQHVNLETPVDAPRYVSHFATCPNADRHRRLTERQALALGYVKEHGPVSSDELGAVLHQHRKFAGGKGHHADERCEWCGDEGSQMAGRLRELGLVEKAAGADGGWIIASNATAKPEDRPAGMLPDDEPLPFA